MDAKLCLLEFSSLFHVVLEHKYITFNCGWNMIFHNLKTNLMKGILTVHNRFCEWGRFEVTISQPTFLSKNPKCVPQLFRPQIWSQNFIYQPKKKRQVAEVPSQTPYASPEIHQDDTGKNAMMTNKKRLISTYFQVFVKIWVNLYSKQTDLPGVSSG